MIKFAKITIEEKKVATFKTQFTIGPFDVGIATTIGNSFRRILLSAISGFSVYAFKIKGVAHEFVVLPNVNIDLMLIILNLKKLVIRATNLDSYLAKPYSITLRCPAKKKGIVTGGDLVCPVGFEIINKDFEICRTLADNALDMDLLVRYGRGFESFSSDVKLIKNCPPTYIPIQAIYSPIKNVAFMVHEHVTKSNIRLNNLELTITTNGAVKETEALVMACKILSDFFTDIGSIKLTVPKVIASEAPSLDDELARARKLPIEHLNLSRRVYTALRNEGVMRIDDVLKKSKTQIERIPNFGQKAIDELIVALENCNIDASFLK